MSTTVSSKTTTTTTTTTTSRPSRYDEDCNVNLCDVSLNLVCISGKCACPSGDSWYHPDFWCI